MVPRYFCRAAQARVKKKVVFFAREESSLITPKHGKRRKGSEINLFSRRISMKVEIGLWFTESWSESLEISFGRKRSLNLEKKSYSFSTLEEKNFFLLVKIWVSFDTLSIQDCRERIVKGEQWQLLSEWEEADLSRSVTFLSYPLMSARQSGGKSALEKKVDQQAKLSRWLC